MCTEDMKEHGGKCHGGGNRATGKGSREEGEQGRGEAGHRGGFCYEYIASLHESVHV